MLTENSNPEGVLLRVRQVAVAMETVGCEEQMITCRQEIEACATAIKRNIEPVTDESPVLGIKAAGFLKLGQFECVE